MQDNIRRLGGPSEAITKLAFHQSGDPESARDGKDDGEYGHNGEQGAVGQRSGFIDNAVFVEAADAEIDRFDDIVYRELGAGDFAFRDPPDIIGNEFPYIGETLIHRSGI